MTEESKLVAAGDGLRPDGSGWFVVNLQHTAWRESERFGSWAGFEGAEKFGDFGINVSILAPGQPACLYHREGLQEGFLVLHGEARAIVNGEERALGQWDYFHCPPGTEHLLVGAGDGPCAILMVGARTPGMKAFYPVDATAARYGGSAAEATGNPREAYGDGDVLRDIPSPWPLDD